MESLAPALPPRFLTAVWQHIVMLNFEAPPELLRPFLPDELELDYFEGRTFVSMVGFRFLNTRVLGVALPWHRHFDEVNLRFYVRRVVAGEERRGVMFIKELVPRRLVSWVARTFYNENYGTVPMRHAITLPRDGRPGQVEYAWRFRDAWHRLGATIEGEPHIPVAGSETAFIVEHYWGYSLQRDGTSMEYRVEHPPWRVWPALVSEFVCDVAALYGPPWRDVLGQRPSSAFVAEGSPVVVRRGVRLSNSKTPLPTVG